jgi:hypothetical protein
MRSTIGAAAVLAAVLLAAGAGATAGVAPRVTVKAPGHSPKINVHWTYRILVTVKGRRVHARLTEQIVDPIGGVHPVEFGKGTKKITNWPIDGTFSDFIIWPKSSRGIPLVFRITVKVGLVKKVVSYHVLPH